jgi:hypothetical protein
MQATARMPASATSVSNGRLRGQASSERTRCIPLTVARSLGEYICRSADDKIRRAGDDTAATAAYARNMSHSDRTLYRVGALAGLATVILFVGAINVTPTLPSPNHGLAAITRSAERDRDGYLTAIYLSAC